MKLSQRFWTILFLGASIILFWEAINISFNSFLFSINKDHSTTLAIIKIPNNTLSLILVIIVSTYISIKTNFIYEEWKSKLFIFIALISSYSTYHNFILFPELSSSYPLGYFSILNIEIPFITICLFILILSNIIYRNKIFQKFMRILSF